MAPVELTQFVDSRGHGMDQGIHQLIGLRGCLNCPDCVFRINRGIFPILIAKKIASTNSEPAGHPVNLNFNFYFSTFIYFQLNCRIVPVQKSPKRPCNRIMSSVSKNIRQISAHRSKGDLNTGTTQNSDPEHLVLIKTQDILSPGGCCQDSPTIFTDCTELCLTKTVTIFSPIKPRTYRS